MKSLISLAALGLATLGYASSACAANFHFEANPSFTATGAMTVTAGVVSVPCTATLKGSTTKAGDAKITSASFSGLTCAGLTPSGLPWKMEPFNTRNFAFQRVTVTAVVLGICGPGHLHALLSPGGAITISGAGLPGLIPCTVSATFRTSPALHIVRD
jgi:hypothetical protein